MMSLIYCKCGCGKEIVITSNHKHNGIPKYILGHNSKDINNPNYGKHSSEETKDKMKKSHLGKPGYWKDKHLTEETKKKLSIVKIGKSYGNKNNSWKGGPIESKKRSVIKRRKLGFIPVNKSISDDEVAHHVTKEFVVYVPEYINKSIPHNIHTGKNMDEVNFYTLNYLFLVYNKGE